MMTLNGSRGEGGGQILRNACALSLVTGQPFQITDIRGRRANPGLMRQHVTAIEAACTISGGTCEGLKVGAKAITFHPGQVTGGEYTFSIGTAGSTGLVLQAILMPLALADAPSRIVLAGGTHTCMAPPFDFLEQTLFPILNRMGPTVSARLIRHGFYPRGGGRIEVDITPGQLQPIYLLDRGSIIETRATILTAGVRPDITLRCDNQIKQNLASGDPCPISLQRISDAEGPGLAVLLERRHETVTTVMSSFGERGVPVEAVVNQATDALAAYTANEAFACEHLADQLIVPFALAGGGSFTTVAPTPHTLSAIEVAHRFTGRRANVEENGPGLYTITIQ